MFADNIGKMTMDLKGANTLRLRTIGNEKIFYTLVLSTNMDSTRNKPCIIFKGNGNTVESRVLQETENITWQMRFSIPSLEQAR